LTTFVTFDSNMSDNLSVQAAKQEVDKAVIPDDEKNVRIIYVSDILLKKDQDIKTMALDIAYVAAQFNRCHSIGGYFAVHLEDKYVAQMFEGKEAEAMQLWTNIQKDRRHKIRWDSVYICNPDKIVSKKWGMVLMTPQILLENLGSNGIKTTSAINSILKGENDEFTAKYKKLTKKMQEAALNAPAKLDKGMHDKNMAKYSELMQKCNEGMSDKSLAEDHRSDLKQAINIVSSW